MSIIISGYQVSEEIHQGANSQVYRGREENTDRPIILKMLRQAYPSPAKIAWFKREYQTTRGLDLPGVITTYDLVNDQHRWFMVLQDFGGKSLDRLLSERRFTTDEFLRIAIKITEILGQVHGRRVLHKDINPSNIVLNPATDELKLIDFGIATSLSRENPSPRDPNVLEGTLAYLSPEQTGRMNRALDYRSDYYSLGVTFYELLTGRLPFLSTDAMELVHSHIAKHPPPPCEVNPKVPKPVAALVMKLLAKNAEDRYQSAQGLKSDLQECLQRLRSDGSIVGFSLGEHDLSDRFQIPQRLYGREREIDKLLSVFEQTTQGSVETLLVSGYSGIGKSALVQEIYRPITQQRGYFSKGKFDQYQRSIPYGSLAQAFTALIHQLLTESEEQLATWREKLIKALGVNAQVIIDVIPELELITGPQPTVPALGMSAAENRFNLVFQHFVAALSNPQRPLVLFLDDLQWADNASLKLLRLLPVAPNIRGLLLIGAYRDNQVDAAHPLMLTLDALRKTGTTVHQIALSALDLADITQLVADTLACDLDRAQPLAGLLLAKTEGNPFFINEFLKTLYAEELFVFDFQQARWQWDLEQIQARQIADNVVDLMAEKVRKLRPDTGKALELAACIGNPFSLRTLALVYRKPLQQTALDIREAMTEGLLLPLSDSYKLMELDTPEPLDDTTEMDYKFAHDRIQQAVYSLISDTDKQTLHQRIGLSLLNNTPHEKRDERIFTIVNQLNQGGAGISQELAPAELAKLNLAAGRKAKGSAAYQSALDYLCYGIEVLEPRQANRAQNPADPAPAGSGWEQHYELTLNLHVEAAEAAYLRGDYQQMEQRVALVVQQAKSLLDKVKAYEIKIHAYLAQHNPPQAVATGLQVMAMLGMDFPAQPNHGDVVQGMQHLHSVLADKRIEDLIDLPTMTDPHQLACMRILWSPAQAAYIGSPELFGLIIFKMVELSAQHGNTPLSARAYACFGLIQCGMVGNIDVGYRFGKLALDLVEKLNAKEQKSSVVFFFNNFIRHWKSALQEIQSPLLDAYQIGLETGDLQFAAFNVFSYSHQSYLMGRELAEIEREMAIYGDAIDNINQQHVLNYHKTYHQAVLNLMGRNTDPCQLVGNACDEQVILPHYIETKDKNGICELHLNKLILCYLFGHYSQALEHANTTEKYIAAATGLYASTVFNFFDSLLRLALLANIEESAKPELLEKIKANQEKMKKWADHAPMNYLHKFYLVEAEQARAQQQDNDAREFYDKAISLAQENGFINEEALANELAGRFYIARKQTHVARHYLNDAHYAYRRWGAVAKVKELEAQHPLLLVREETSQQPPLADSVTRSGEYALDRLDLTSVLKASQAIAGEIVLDKLLRILIKIVIENAGAQKGILILQKDNELLIEAEGEIDSDDFMILQSVPLSNSQNLASSIVSYVARTKETVISDDITQDDRFSNDPYIERSQSKSILCLPLLNQTKLTGLLYLENDLISGAFTPDRLELLNLLSAQIAISIENARLYEHLEQRVEERTQTLSDTLADLQSMQNQLVEAEKMAALGDLVAGVAHEINTPVGIGVTAASLLEQKTSAIEQLYQANQIKRSDLQTYIDTAKQASVMILSNLNRAAHLIQSFKQVAVDQSTDEYRDFYFAAYLDEILLSLNPRLKLTKHTIKVDGDDGLTLYSDPGAFWQIVTNLVMNSLIHAYDESDQGHIEISFKQQDSRFIFSYKDDGRGIAAQHLAHIFEPFYTTQRETGGSGLGLHIIYNLVTQKLGGSIHCESQERAGVRFTIELPMNG